MKLPILIVLNCRTIQNMKVMKKIFLLLICFLGFLKISYSQDEKENSKFLKAIIYLQNNKEIRDEIRNVFRDKLIDNCYLTYEVANKVLFIGIDVFEEYLEKNEKFDTSDFYSNNFFESEDHDYKNLFPENKNSVKIHFSKAFSNFLIVELSLQDYSDSLLKLGKSIKILFVFDKKNTIKKGVFKTLINN